jgi:hypothetical protein
LAKILSLALFVVGFVGSQNRLGFVGGCRACRDTKFQVWLNQVFKTRLISSAKVLVKFILALWSSFLAKILVCSFWFLLKSKVRAIILSVLWRWFWFSISESCAKASQQSVHLTLGILRQSQAVFYALSFFWLDGFAVPAPAQVTQTVRRFPAK